MFGHSKESEIPGETVKIFCEADPHYYLTAREYDDVVLLPGDESNPHQQWIMDCTWATKVRDRAGSPAFALVNKATRQALRHGHELNEKVNISPYSKEELNEAVLWTQSDDVGNGYKCIRPVDNTDLNLDANHGDKESGGIRDGTDLILFKWKKHENQKWKIIPISNKVSQVEHYGGEEDEGVKKYGGAPCDEPTYGSGTTGYGGAPYDRPGYGHPGFEEEANYGRLGHDEGKNYDRPDYKEGKNYGRPGYEEGTNYGRPGYGEGTNYGRPGYEEGANYGRPGYEEGTNYGRPGYKGGANYDRPDDEEGTNYGRPGYEEGSKYERPSYEEGSKYERPSYEEGTNYGHPGYEESPKYGGGPAPVIHTHHHNDFPEATSYQEAPAHDFRMPEGQLVKIYCEQSPDFFLTVHNHNVVLASGDVDDISQHWIKVDEWGTKVRDEAGFPAFALVNKANLKALKHGSKEWDKVELKHYDANDLDESILWTQSADVGHGYQCIRPVTDINLNLDAKLADGKYGNIEDGNELILFKWKKQKNQKWKMLPVY